MTEVTINGVNYTLTNEPTHGVVRLVQKGQSGIYTTLLSSFEEIVTGQVNGKSMTIQEAIGIIMKKDPAAVREFSMNLAEHKQVAVISLATGKYFTVDDFDNMPEKEYKQIYDKCFGVIGGNMDDFFPSYDKTITSKMNSKEAQL